MLHQRDIFMHPVLHYTKGMEYPVTYTRGLCNTSFSMDCAALERVHNFNFLFGPAQNRNGARSKWNCYTRTEISICQIHWSQRAIIRRG